MPTKDPQVRKPQTKSTIEGCLTRDGMMETASLPGVLAMETMPITIPLKVREMAKTSCVNVGQKVVNPIRAAMAPPVPNPINQGSLYLNRAVSGVPTWDWMPARYSGV